MSPERMQQVTRFFEQALERPESELAAFVKIARFGASRVFDHDHVVGQGGQGFLHRLP